MFKSMVAERVLERNGNGIQQALSFLRVVPVGSGKAHGERHSSRIADQMALALSLGTIGRIWPGRGR